MTDTWLADEKVHAFVKDVAAKHRPELTEANITTLFRDPPVKRSGRVVLATIRKATPTEKALYSPDPDYILTIGSTPWTENSEGWRTALIHHELCHAVRSYDGEGNVRYGLRGHDLEEFEEVVATHGLWKGDVERFGRVAAKQLDMFDVEEPVRRLRAIGATVTVHEAAQ